MEFSKKEIETIIHLHETPPKPSEKLTRAMGKYLKSKEDIMAMKSNDYDGY